MSWKDQLNKAVESIKNTAESGTVQRYANKPKETATNLAQSARNGLHTL